MGASMGSVLPRWPFCRMFVQIVGLFGFSQHVLGVCSRGAQTNVDSLALMLLMMPYASLCSKSPVFDRGDVQLSSKVPFADLIE